MDAAISKVSSYLTTDFCYALRTLTLGCVPPNLKAVKTCHLILLDTQPTFKRLLTGQKTRVYYLLFFSFVIVLQRFFSEIPRKTHYYLVFANLFSKLPDRNFHYRHQPSQSRVDIEHWLKANAAWSARSITRCTSVLAWCYVGEDLSAKLVTDLF